ncbi:hypothetical protein LINPERHAP1_LOCUS8212 [Linum perenne]
MRVGSRSLAGGESMEWKRGRKTGGFQTPTNVSKDPTRSSEDSGDTETQFQDIEKLAANRRTVWGRRVTSLVIRRELVTNQWFYEVKWSLS